MPLAVFLLASLAVVSEMQHSSQPDAEGILLEVRSYQLKPGERGAFHQRFERESLPLLEKAGIDVVAFGPSLHDGDAYFLMRAFQSLEDRQRQEDVFYSSAAWRDGPRAAVMAAIVSYTTAVIEIDRATLEGLRRTMTKTTTTSTAAADLDTLARLNRDYIAAVKASDVQRFEELLADDFLCTLPDGTLIDRAQFLENTAKPYLLQDLEAHDVNVRLMGDFAIVHARTTFALPGGTKGSGRYTDIWARRNGRWVAVAAHVTRR